MLDRYYRLRGWSPEGAPLPATLQRLGLGCLTGDPPTLAVCGQEAGA
jgi:hypothetical protein